MEKLRSLKEHEKAAIEYGLSKSNTKEMIKKDILRLTTFIVLYSASLLLYMQGNILNVYFNFEGFVILHLVVALFGVHYLIKSAENDAALTYGIRLSETARKKIEAKQKLLADTFKQIFVAVPIMYAIMQLFGAEMPFYAVIVVFAINYLVGLMVINKLAEKKEKEMSIQKINDSIFFADKIKELNSKIEQRNQFEEDAETRKYLINQVNKLNEIIHLFEKSNLQTKIDTNIKVEKVFQIVTERMSLEIKEEMM